MRGKKRGSGKESASAMMEGRAKVHKQAGMRVSALPLGCEATLVNSQQGKETKRK